jgi:mRNA-degrading endonuclease RelE of RelBE toxin-antitoxin system
MIYDIKIRKKVQKSLSKIPNPFQSNIIEKVRKLANNPFPPQSKKLTGR